MKLLWRVLLENCGSYWVWDTNFLDIIILEFWKRAYVLNPLARPHTDKHCSKAFNSTNKYKVIFDSILYIFETQKFYDVCVFQHLIRLLNVLSSFPAVYELLADCQLPTKHSYGVREMPDTMPVCIHVYPVKPSAVSSKSVDISLD